MVGRPVPFLPLNSEVLLEPEFHGVRNIAQIPRSADTRVSEPLVQAMGSHEPRIGPEDHPPRAARPRVVLGEPHQAFPPTPTALVGPHVKTVEFRQAGFGTVDRHAGADAPAFVFGHPECAALAGNRRSGLSQLRQIVVGIDEAAGIIREA